MEIMVAHWKNKYKKDIPADVMTFHHSCDIVDLHIDTFMLSRMFGVDMTKRGRAPLFMNWKGHCVDLPRLKEGGVNVPCWGVVVQPFIHGKFFDGAMAFLDSVYKFVECGPCEMRIAHTGTEVEEIVSAGGTAGLLGMEGAHPLMGDISKLEILIDRGIRYLTLTHFTSNEAAVAATGPRPDFTGLSDFGREVVEYCNGKRVIVDLAHTSKETFMQAASLSKRPVIVSHTGVRGVHDMWRNIDDEQIDAVAESGGVIGVIFQSMFLGSKMIESLSAWIDHVDYVKNRIGIDHVAIGSDFDGMIIPPLEIEDVSDMPQITAALVRRGYSEEELRKLLGQNALRVFREVCG